MAWLKVCFFLNFNSKFLLSSHFEIYPTDSADLNRYFLICVDLHQLRAFSFL